MTLELSKTLGSVNSMVLSFVNLFQTKILFSLEQIQIKFFAINIELIVCSSNNLQATSPSYLYYY